jgi:hypothetical protein
MSKDTAPGFRLVMVPVLLIAVALLGCGGGGARAASVVDDFARSAKQAVQVDNPRAADDAFNRSRSALEPATQANDETEEVVAWACAALDIYEKSGPKVADNWIKAQHTSSYAQVRAVMQRLKAMEDEYAAGVQAVSAICK